jgi:hypothetical protein
MDGILVATKIMDEEKRANKELILFKVNFEKAYDCMDWATSERLWLK